MAKGTPSQWVTSVSHISPEDIYIRGYAMQDLVGTLSFSAISFLIIRGKIPTPGEAKMMDVIQSSILDYALQKSGTIAARSVVSVNPQMTAGLSAGVLAAGPYAVSPEDTGRFISNTYSDFKKSDNSLEAAAESLVSDLRSKKQRIPGLGHPVFRGVDPRAEKLKGFAQSYGVWGEANEWYSAVHSAFKNSANKPDLVMNDVGMLAGIMTQMGFTPEEMTGVAVLSTFPGLIAHISEEMQSGVRGRIIPEDNVDYNKERHDFLADAREAGWQL